MTNENKKWRRRGPEQWQQLLRRQADSGQSVVAFCRAEALSPASFYRWRRQLLGLQPAATSDAAPAFLDLGQLAGGGGNASDDTGGAGWELELTLGESVVVRLRGR